MSSSSHMDTHTHTPGIYVNKLCKALKDIPKATDIKQAEYFWKNSNSPSTAWPTGVHLKYITHTQSLTNSAALEMDFSLDMSLENDPGTQAMLSDNFCNT